MEGARVIFGIFTALQGDGNTGSGVQATENGAIKLVGGTLVTITGALGDLQLADGAAISYGTGAGEFEEAAGYAGIFTRAQENAGSAASPRADSSIIRT